MMMKKIQKISGSINKIFEFIKITLYFLAPCTITNLIIITMQYDTGADVEAPTTGHYLKRFAKVGHVHPNWEIALVLC